jgi:hypothetical protein
MGWARNDTRSESIEIKYLEYKKSMLVIVIMILIIMMKIIYLGLKA